MAVDLDHIRVLLSNANRSNHNDQQKEAIYDLLNVLDVLSLEVSRLSNGENEDGR